MMAKRINEPTESPPIRLIADWPNHVGPCGECPLEYRVRVVDRENHAAPNRRRASRD